MTTEGWLLDVYPDYEHNQITSWIKSGTTSTRVTGEFYPRFYVHASSDKLRKLVGTLKFLSSVEALEYKHRRIDLVDPKLYKVLEVTMNDYHALRANGRRTCRKASNPHGTCCTQTAAATLSSLMSGCMRT